MAKVTTAGQRIRDAVAREFGGVPPNDLGDSFFPTAPDYTDVALDVTAAAAGVRVPEQASRLPIASVTFTADGGNTGAAKVQRGIGPGGGTAPAFDSAAFSVPAGEHIVVGPGPIEQWWVKTVDADDVVHVTGKRT